MGKSKDESPTPLLKQKGRPPSPDSSAEIRFCKRHGWIEFHNHARSGGGRRWRCKRCVGEAVTRRKQKVKQTLVREAGGCCAICGYDRTVVNLHFHHVDPSKKSLSMSMRGGKSLDAFREEAKKCVLVCANCHGEIEAGLIESPAPGSKYAGHGMTYEPADPATPQLSRIRINSGLPGEYSMLDSDTGSA